MKKPTKMKRKIVFEPGYDFIVQPTKERGANYGRHGLNMRFLLEGSKGVVQFLLFTGWLPMIESSYGWEPTYKGSSEPMAADIGYHSYKPMYKGQPPMDKKCPFLYNKKCYYDGSGSLAEEYFAELCNKGEDALFKKMEGFYKDTFK